MVKRNSRSIAPNGSGQPTPLSGKGGSVLLSRVFLPPAGLVLCVFLLTAGAAEEASPDSAGTRSTGLSASDDKGPTVQLSYSKETVRANPISSFSYFIPLICLTPVDRESSAGNEQRIGFISHERTVTGPSFQTTCDFEIRGKGFHKYKFDAAAIIAARVRDKKDDEPLVNLLDSVMFEGEGFGRIVIEGRISGSKEIVDQVDLQFHARGKAGPVTIGLYDVKLRDGQYDYDNRSNESVARVSTLTFRRSATTPRMGVTVASIVKAGASEGPLAGLRGAIANLFLIKPPRIDPVGNEAVLQFGNAMSAQEPEFTFPKARNFKGEKTVARATREVPVVTIEVADGGSGPRAGA